MNFNMERYLIVILFSVGFCSEFDAILPVNYESGLAEDEKFQENKKSELTFKDDLAKIDEDYGKYIGGKKNSKEYGDEDYQQRQRKYSNEELDKIFGYTGPTANDEPDNLIRPCALEDWECIRRFFASNGKCQPAYGPIPDPLYQNLHTIYFASPNMSAAGPGLQIRGLSTAKIRQLYVNKKSGNLVFAFDVRDFNGTIPRAYLSYKRTAKESIILAGYGTIDYGPVTFTAVIPMVPDLRLDLADCHIDVQIAYPPFFLSPTLGASPDPDVVTGIAALVSRFPLSTQEGIFFEAQFITAAYIQKNICDFGLKLISA